MLQVFFQNEVKNGRIASYVALSPKIYSLFIEPADGDKGNNTSSSGYETIKMKGFSLRSNERQQNPISHQLLKDFVVQMHRGQFISREVKQQNFLIDKKTKTIRTNVTKKSLANHLPLKRFINSKASMCLTYGFGITKYENCMNGVSNKVYDQYMK